jgi:NDP-sugar pyrophosphorylase family protein
MLHWSIDSLLFQNATYIFVVRKEHLDNHPEYFEDLKKYVKNSIFVGVEHLTEGPACTALLAKKYIDNEAPLFIANCDQYIDWDIKKFEKEFSDTKIIDGSIITIKSQRSDYSYAKLDSNNNVCETAEKKVISEHATVGYYYFKNGNIFVKSAEQMIQKNIRTNNEFYICPCYNQTIKMNKTIKIFPAEKMWCLGTPKDVEDFEKIYKNENNKTKFI